MISAILLFDVPLFKSVLGVEAGLPQGGSQFGGMSSRHGQLPSQESPHGGAERQERQLMGNPGKRKKLLSQHPRAAAAANGQAQSQDYPGSSGIPGGRAPIPAGQGGG